MLSLTKCKQILNKKGVFYTDEEIVILRDILYKIAEIEYRSYKEKLVKEEISEMKQTKM